MATGVEIDIDLQAPAVRRNATLLSAADQIPTATLTRDGVSRMAAGITWLPWGEGSLTAAAVGCNVVYDKDGRALPEIAVQPAFLLYDGLLCSTLGGALDEMWARLDYNFDLYLSSAFAAELASGTASGGLGLKGDATYVPRVVSGSAVPLMTGMAHLEANLADALNGGIGMIHLTPGLLGIARAEGIVEWDDGQYRTATGHVVIGDAGFTGQVTPQGQSAASSGQAWIYSSGRVWYATTRAERLDGEPGEAATKVRRNEDRPLMEEYGLVAFDPNLLGAARVTVGPSS